MQKKNRAVRTTVIVIIILALIAAGIIFIPKLIGSSEDSAASSGTLSAQATTGDIISSLSATGNISESLAEVTMPYDVSVDSVLVSAGDTVAKGDPIAKLSSSSLSSLITSAKSELADVNDELAAIDDGDTSSVYVYSKFSGTVSKVFTEVGDDTADVVADNGALITIKLTDGGTFKVANNEGEVAKVYVEKGDTVYSGTTLLKLTVPDVVTDEKTLKAQRKALLKRIETLTTLQTTGYIYAPYAGTVDSLSITAGAALENMDGDTDYMGTAAKIALPDKMDLTVSVDELDISVVKEGQESSVELDALEGQTFAGTVASVSDGVDESGAASFTSVITFERADGMFAGMSATATIVKEKKEGVLTLPLAAVQQYGSELYVYTSLAEDGTLGGETIVETGLSDGATTEITSGIAEGITVYYVDNSSSSTSTFGGMGMGGFGGEMRTFTGGNAPAAPSGGAPGGAGGF
jgi:multidrug efflux pump subunit AcrA (membrane-fusion protein)